MALFIEVTPRYSQLVYNFRTNEYSIDEISKKLLAEANGVGISDIHSAQVLVFPEIIELKNGGTIITENLNDPAQYLNITFVYPRGKVTIYPNGSFKVKNRLSMEFLLDKMSDIIDSLKRK